MVHDMIRRALGPGIGVALCALAAASSVMHAQSFRQPAAVINSGCTGHLQQQSPSFRGNGCIGELGGTEHRSPSFRMLAGFCPTEHWLLGQGSTVATPAASPISTVLVSPAPNPATRSVGIGFSVRQGERATVRIFDPGGRLVTTLAKDIAGPAAKHLSWDLSDAGERQVAAGVYFVRLETGSTKLTRRFVVLAP